MYFDDKQDLMNEPGESYQFFLTFDSPVRATRISVFLPSFATYLKNSVYPNCAIKVYVEKLEDDGYEFFASIDENGYRDGMTHGNYPLGFGALYLYAKIGDASISDITAGFWQN